MAKEFYRSDRVADAVQRSLATLIPQEISDPRLGIVNINAVTVTRDLAHAKVYVTLVGQNEPAACKESVDVLNSASNFLRNLVGRDLTMRSTPKLQFIYDESSVRGQALRQLIDKAIASDSGNRDGSGD